MRQGEGVENDNGRKVIERFGGGIEEIEGATVPAATAEKVSTVKTKVGEKKQHSHRFSHKEEVQKNNVRLCQPSEIL